MTRSSSSILALAFLSGSSLAIAQPGKPGEKGPPPHAAAAGKAPEAPPAAAPAKANAAKNSAVAGGAAPAAPAGPAAMPTPAPELDLLYKGFEGNWKCETTMAAGSMGPNSPEQKVKSMVKIAKARDMGGMWYRGEYQIKKTKEIPGWKATFMLGYDPLSKAALNVQYDNMGGAGLATSPNANGDTLTFVGESYVMGQKMKTRETMIKKGPKEVEHKFEADMGKGFQVMGTDICKK